MTFWFRGRRSATEPQAGLGGLETHPSPRVSRDAGSSPSLPRRPGRVSDGDRRVGSLNPKVPARLTTGSRGRLSARGHSLGRGEPERGRGGVGEVRWEGVGRGGWRDGVGVGWGGEGPGP